MKKSGTGLNMENNLKEKFQEKFAEEIKQAKKKQNFKTILTIILSNIMLYLLMSSATDSASAPLKCNQDGFTSHKNHLAIKLPLNVHIPFIDNKNEYQVSIYNDLNVLIIANAYLRHNNKNPTNGEGLLETEEELSYHLEIPQNELLKIISNSKSKLHAYPANIAINLPNLSKKGTDYEIIF